jgi:hypothetical protein
MLETLEKKNEKFGFDVRAHLFDAAAGKNISERLDYCILNELITDLPTEMACKKTAKFSTCFLLKT